MLTLLAALDDRLQASAVQWMAPRELTDFLWRAREALRATRVNALAAAQAKRPSRRAQDAVQLIDEMMDLSTMLFHLTAESSGGWGAVRHNTRARAFNTTADLVEKLASGDIAERLDRLTADNTARKELLMFGLSFLLARLGDTSFIRSAVTDFIGEIGAFRAELADQAWSAVRWRHWGEPVEAWQEEARAAADQTTGLIFDPALNEVQRRAATIAILTTIFHVKLVALHRLLSGGDVRQHARSGRSPADE